MYFVKKNTVFKIDVFIKAIRFTKFLMKLQFLHNKNSDQSYEFSTEV